MQTAAVTKADLVFGRMRIGIDRSRVERQVQNIGRKNGRETRHRDTHASPHVRQRAITDTSAINEPVLHIGLAAIERGQAHPTGDGHALSFALNVDSVFGERISTNSGNSLPTFILGRCRLQLQYPLDDYSST